MTRAATERIKLRVTGRVQGVYYRASTQERARNLGLSGWIRNTRDGAVELEAEGPASAIEKLVEWCRQGPPAARVRDVEIDSLEPVGESTGFQIRY